MMTDQITDDQITVIRDQINRLGDLVLPKFKQFAPISIIAFLTATLNAALIGQEQSEARGERKLNMREIAIKSLTD
jgi:hypothetical protein